ncbi:hypothetical protein PPACK8108_LOCUS2752 [Phakopsora pachyrhizi]|uniref:Transposase n=1 Tax=Phakopsora pachyrhizi TaxID=170000 RepID=A0AAV0ALB2_PHAPC|nr:hypothetical protein PPACK8108_LOCUS2752 [Phakopsora pachyrhizi]
MACQTSPGKTAEIFGTTQDGKQNEVGIDEAGKGGDVIYERDNTRVNIETMTVSLVVRPRPKSTELRIVREADYRLGKRWGLNDLGLLMSALLVTMKSLVPNAIDWQDWS